MLAPTCVPITQRWGKATAVCPFLGLTAGHVGTGPYRPMLPPVPNAPMLPRWPTRPAPHLGWMVARALMACDRPCLSKGQEARPSPLTPGGGEPQTNRGRLPAGLLRQRSRDYRVRRPADVPSCGSLLPLSVILCNYLYGWSRSRPTRGQDRLPRQVTPAPRVAGPQIAPCAAGLRRRGPRG